VQKWHWRRRTLDVSRGPIATIVARLSCVRWFVCVGSGETLVVRALLPVSGVPDDENLEPRQLYNFINESVNKPNNGVCAFIRVLRHSHPNRLGTDVQWVTQSPSLPFCTARQSCGLIWAWPSF